MIENMNDLFSILSLVIIILSLILFGFRSLLKKRERKMIEREIEYYKEW